MFWIQKSKPNIHKKIVSIHGSTYLLTTSHPSSPIAAIFKNLSIFIIHILIPCISTRQWYLWPSLLELGSILVRRVTSPGHTMSTGHVSASARDMKLKEFIRINAKIQRHDMKIHETCAKRITTSNLVLWLLCNADAMVGTWNTVNLYCGGDELSTIMEDGPSISSREIIFVVKIVWTKIVEMQWLQKKLFQNHLLPRHQRIQNGRGPKNASYRHCEIKSERKAVQLDLVEVL